RVIRLSRRAGSLHVRSVELARPARCRNRRMSMILGCEQLPVLARRMFVLRLYCHGCSMRLAPIRFLLPSRPRFDTARAVEADVPRVVRDDGAVVDVRHIGHVHVDHRAVVEERAASPLAAEKAYAAVSEAVVNPAVEANMRPPVASVPAIEAARETPVARGPEHADRRNYPCAGYPIVAAVVIPCPITRSPQITRARTDRLRVNRQRGRADPYRNSDPYLRGRCRRERQHRDRQHQNSEYHPANGAFHFHCLSLGLT